MIQYVLSYLMHFLDLISSNLPLLYTKYYDLIVILLYALLLIFSYGLISLFCMTTSIRHVEVTDHMICPLLPYVM